MTSNCLVKLLFTIAALTAISIGLGVGLSKRNAALSLGRNSNLATDVTVGFPDDCVDAVDDDSIDNDAVDNRAEVPQRRRLVRRRATATYEAEWPWEAELSEGLAFSMEYSMSVSSKSGKSSKGSSGKSGKSLRCHGKSGKSSASKSYKGYSMSMPSIGYTDSPVDGFNAPSERPTVHVTVNTWSYSPTTPAPATSVIPLEMETPVPEVDTLPPTPTPTEASTRPSPMPITSFAPPNVVPETTNFPTSGATPTVSTEVTGPPTKPDRDPEPI